MMANSNPVDPTNAGTLAQQIVAILINQDSVTRQRAVHAAMMLLGEVAPPQRTSQPDASSAGQSDDNNAGLSAFFDREGDMKPADYAHLCAAYYYSLYGSTPFSIDELKTIATDAAVVLPDRPDSTLGMATKKGKKLYQSVGKGFFKPTAAGGVVFGERWGVKPGRMTKPSPTAATNGAPDAKTR